MVEYLEKFSVSILEHCASTMRIVFSSAPCSLKNETTFFKCILLIPPPFDIRVRTGFSPSCSLFQNIINGYSVFLGRLHADILYAIVFHPSSHTADVTVCRWELANIKDGAKRFRVCFADSGHKYRFVDVNARADREFDISNRGCNNLRSVIKGSRFKSFRCVSFFRHCTFYSSICEACHGKTLF